MTINKVSYSQGFTLIELLVVVAVIGLLASIAVVALQNTRAEARDTKRIADMRQIYTALEIYNEQYGEYPPNTGHGLNNCGGPPPMGWIHSGYAGFGENFLPELADEGLMTKVSVDPIPKEESGIPDYCYGYFRYGPGYAGCDDTRGNFFVLIIKDLESWDGPGQHPTSPGWRCAGGDWTGYEWAIGAYEK